MTSAVVCSHLDQIAIPEPPAQVAGCEECLNVGSGWLHLPKCQSCGKFGCCDSSPNRHARAHAAVEPGEDWSWCFLAEVMFVLQSG